jgi:hypothetical protein
VTPLPPTVLVVFFFSGAAGLVYEVLWTRQLALIFGVTTYAVRARELADRPDRR